MVAYFFAPQVIFLSTLSLRRATCNLLVPTSIAPISIHALLAESDHRSAIENQYSAEISIHALLAESDARIIDPTFGQEVFLSTLSLRRATIGGVQTMAIYKISIHALLAESDLDTIAKGWDRLCISIHALLAESDNSRRFLYPRNGISIHALLAESDLCPICQWRRSLISIHALLAESDQLTSIFAAQKQHFYPRSPCGERP